MHVGSLVGPLLLLRSRGLGLRALISGGVASLPSAAVGGLGRSTIEERLGTPRQVAVLGAAAATAVWLVDRRAGAGRAQSPAHLSARDLLVIGLAQSAALVPGVSRSGVTYAAARSRGLDRSSAADVALVTGIPVIVGASTLIGATHGKELRDQAATVLPAVAAAAATSVIMKPAARPALMRGSGLFATYRWLIGAVVLRSRQEH